MIQLKSELQTTDGRPAVKTSRVLSCNVELQWHVDYVGVVNLMVIVIQIGSVINNW